MNQKYTKEQITQCCTAYNRGTPVAKLVEKYEGEFDTIVGLSLSLTKKLIDAAVKK